MSQTQVITLRVSKELHEAVGRATFEKNLSGNAIGILGLESWIRENSPLVYKEYLEKIKEKHKRHSQTAN